MTVAWDKKLLNVFKSINHKLTLQEKTIKDLSLIKSQNHD